jgi:His-Xaa-Ser system radical SAM maturase HxsB
MINFFPHRFQEINKAILITNDAGDFFYTDADFLKKIIYKELSDQDYTYLFKRGFVYRTINDFYFNSFSERLKKRKKIGNKLKYLIVIPTLRCDLSCSYCQVSRANIDALNFDWTEKTLFHFKNFLLKNYDGKSIKIEFQGGEPTIRIDIIDEVINFCDSNDINAEFIICTNLSNITTSLERIIERDDVYISTSIDGNAHVHTKNRTLNSDTTKNVINNYQIIKSEYGQNKVSALPTITEDNFSIIEDIINEYISLGETNIYLRPVNYQGFARKKYKSSRDFQEAWNEAYLRGLNHIFMHNYENETKIKEFNFEIALKRIFTLGYNSHVDLRSPNPACIDYLVINYDGTIYPSDEARMLSRINHTDLSLGNVQDGVNSDKADVYNWEQNNDTHKDCIHCAFMPYCGIDNIDDISRYNRVDAVKFDTFFCQNNMNIFSYIFDSMRKNDPTIIYNINGHLHDQFDNRPLTSEYIYD